MAWDSNFPNRISKDNDPVFPTKEEGWYKKEEETEHNTQFEQFVKKSGLEGSNNFSFVEFVTQNATNLNPIFTIRFDEVKNGDVNFELINKDTLSVINNKSNCWKEEKYRTAFVNTTYKILVSEVSQLNDVQKKDLESMYRFLCTYQSVWGKKLKCIYLITSRLFEEETKDISSGGLILVCKEELDLFELSLLSMVVNLCYREKGGKNWEQKCRKEAVKSAKAAIMSRNMSHNIGSHVMSYLKQHLGSVKDIVSDGILSDLINGESELAKKLENTTENTTLPFLMGLGHFVSYLQERQDFIATIATDYIPYFGNVNFKDAIYDELNPDKRAERHSERKNGKTDNILLGNIARSEGLGRKDQTISKRLGQLSDIVLKFRYYNERTKQGFIFDGDPVVNGNNVAIAGREDAHQALEEMRKREISLPGGVIGRQAIFSIVENLIRNTAKHGNWRDQGQLELTFEFFDKDSIPVEFVNIKKREVPFLEKLIKNGQLNTTEEKEYNQIKEELKSWTEDAAPIDKFHHWAGRDKHNSLMEVLYLFYSESLDADDLDFVTITDNVSVTEEAVKKLREALTEDYIDENSKMKEGNKGIKEIRISAAWLRGAKNEEEYYNSGAQVVEPQRGQKAPLVYVRQHNGCLQYIICLQKPRRIAVVSRRPISESSINALKKYNCRYYTPKTYCEERNKSFEFIIYDDANEQEEKEYCYEVLRKISSTRFWKLSEIEELAKENTDGEMELFNKLKEVTEDGIKEILSPLYKKLSHFEEGDFILIDDKTATANNKKRVEEDPNYKKSAYISVCEGITNSGNYKYIYRSHHDTDEQYTNFTNAVNKGVIVDNIFVEGITGHNSTDRLIRNEKLDDVWFYKHLHAMKEQIAIFDERLFTKIFGLEEAHLKFEGVPDINDENRKKYRKRYKTEIIKDDEERWCSLLDKELPEQDKIFKEAFKDDVTSIEEADAKTGIKPIVYRQKGVYVFTLIQDPHPAYQNRFNLYGLSNKNNIGKGICAKIATLSWDSGKGLIFKGEITNEDNNYKMFDSFSIHQGLLDKLYEAFGIKEKPEEKERLTRQFHATFSSLAVSVSKPDDKGSEKADEKADYHFLPGMCIHSGRSKPSYIDMPQKLPFIQYASIENAVLDCKYSLVELLDFARYE